MWTLCTIFPRGPEDTTAQSNMFIGAAAFQGKFACADAITGPASSCEEPIPTRRQRGGLQSFGNLRDSSD